MSSTNEWPLVQLGKLVEKTSETKGGSDIPVYSITKHAGFVSDYFKKNVHSKDQSKYKVVNEGEFAYATIHLDEGSIGIAPEKSAVSPMYTTFRIVSADIDPQFLLRFLKSDAALAQYAILGTGSIERRKNINFEAFSRLSIPLPPLAEQQRIAEILDQVENLKKLNEEQYLLLSSSLGRSLIFELASLNAPSVKLSDISTISSGSTPSRKKSGYYGGSIPWVKTNEVNGREIFDTEEKLTELGLKESSCKIYPAGTVLIAMYGQGATRGQAGLLGVRAATNQACASVVPHDLEDSEFIFEALKANYEQLRSLGRGGTQPNLNLSLVKDFQIPYPSKEQRQEFRERIAAVHKIKLMNAERLAKLTEVSQALKTRAFAGQL